jgi:hypothetical protein
LCLSTASSRTTKKGQQVLLAAPLIESKGVTRATNANAAYHESALAPSKIHSLWISPPSLPRASSRLAMLEKLHLAKAFLGFFQGLVGVAKIFPFAGNYLISAFYFLDRRQPPVRN